MNDTRVKVLVLELDTTTGSFISGLLAEAWEGFECVTCRKLAEAQRLLKTGNFSTVLIDFHHSPKEGKEALTQLHALAPELPIITVAGINNEALAIESLRNGAQDCLFKRDLSVLLLTRAIRYGIERKRGEETRYRLAAIVESSRDAIIGMSLEGLIVSWNPGAERIFGYSFEDVVGRAISTLAPPDYPDEIPALLEMLNRGEFIKDFETVRIKADGQRVHVAGSISPIQNSTGSIIGASLIARDIEERLRADEERENLLRELQNTLAQVKTLSGLLPICACCKKIRDDQGYWTQVEVYVHRHSDAEFTHGICPDCAAAYRAAMPENRRAV